jgi:uncharacterized HAD superfamily protein/hypoxanthine phosphoribosyltransferase
MTRVAWRTHEDLVRACRENVSRLRTFDIDAVVGVPRSGMLPATQIALSLMLPLSDVKSFCAGRLWGVSGHQEEAASVRRVLLVEDSVSTGADMRRAAEMILAARPDVTIIRCAAYTTKRSARNLDIYFEMVSRPRIFEWNWFRHPLLEACCVDVDGILCIDPTKAERRDEGLYRAFLEKTPPCVKPTVPIGALVTGRREQYRAETERWMASHGIPYRSLHMLAEPFGSQTIERHATHKADVYRASDAVLFIESDAGQAELIAELAGKDVICLSTLTHYPGAA